MRSSRRIRHTRVASALGALDDVELTRLVQAAPAGILGTGGSSSVIDVAGDAVFVKLIPITDRELANHRSTRDLVGLPMACQYGMHRIPGPSFNAWRELAANLLVTEAVSAGECDSFAMLHHWQVLPIRPASALEPNEVAAAVSQFGDDPGVRTRFQELADATHSLGLFLEAIPSALVDRLASTVEYAERLEGQLREITGALRRSGLLHMDGHFGNLRADDDLIFLVDFGLATSLDFDLNPTERDFAIRHENYDDDYASMRLVNWIVTELCGVAVPPGGDLAERNAYIERCAAGNIPECVPDRLARILDRHAQAAARVNDFHWRLMAGHTNLQYR